jgi:release factor glutamine methyltransferase
MISLLEALSWGENQLRQIDAGQAKFDAQLLLAEILNIPRQKLLTSLANEMPADKLDAFAALIKRRANGEPISQLLGAAEFYGRRFFVNQHVLTPRPETELIIDIAKRLAPQQVIDVGTGSGAIAVTLAKELDAAITASDIDEHALGVARANAARHEAEVDFHLTSLLPFAPEPHTFIAANLPYIPRGMTLPIDVLGREPHHSLFSGHDGLDDYHKLLMELDAARSENVIVAMEILPEQKEALTLLVKDLFPSAEIDCIQDLSGRDRLILVQV